jgi:allantoinase
VSALTIRNGSLVTRASVSVADVAIDDERIVAIGRDLPATAHEIDASGLMVLPGIIDVHLHFNEPGRTEWEGAATGSRALAAGGGTVFFDMPLNSSPCTVNAAAFDAKRRALEQAAITDFGLWGGLVPGSVAHMAELADRGVVGFKAFMCDSGLPEYPRCDDVTLLDGMREAARLRLPVAVHAENGELIQGLAARMPGSDARAFLASRPLVAELDAIQRALLLAGETQAMLHIVHVSSGRGVAMAAEARARGVDVSIETCPHYLFFTADDVERLGNVAKCAPPMRSAADRDELWAGLRDGRVDIVASDHSPAEPSLKQGPFATAWGGIAGAQSTLAVLVERGHHGHGLTWNRIAQLLGSTPASRFRVRHKGSIEAGFDADLTLVAPDESFTLNADDLLQKHKVSPYLGASFRGVVKRTILRGQTIFENGRCTATATGRFVRPQ